MVYGLQLGFYWVHMSGAEHVVISNLISDGTLTISTESNDFTLQSRSHYACDHLRCRDSSMFVRGWYNSLLLLCIRPSAYLLKAVTRCSTALARLTVR